MKQLKGVVGEIRIYTKACCLFVSFMAMLPAASYGQNDNKLQIEEDDFGTILNSSKWDSKYWSSNLMAYKIPVCWENPDQSNRRYRFITRGAVEDTWSSAAPIKFFGWGTCESKSRGIRIHVSEEGPHVDVLGKYLDAKPNGMELNFTFSTWSTSCQTDSDFCVYAIAVHEFGHALGFTHEQNRDDAPKECQAEKQGTNGDYKVTEYDPNSVMNYCNPEWLGDGRLSNFDMLAVSTIYPRR